MGGRIKTGGDGSNSEDDLRQHCEGTLLEFLDEACTAYSNFMPHSFHIDQAKDQPGSGKLDVTGSSFMRTSAVCTRARLCPSGDLYSLEV